jgi:hypothetical protein
VTHAGFLPVHDNEYALKGDGDAFLVGAQIEDVSDSSDFDLFKNVFDFIMDVSARP